MGGGLNPGTVTIYIRKGLILMCGSSGIRVHHGREAWLQATGTAEEAKS